MSEYLEPTICIDTGSPNVGKPQGTAAAGCCVRLNGYVTATIPPSLHLALGRDFVTGSEGRDRDLRCDEQIVGRMQHSHSTTQIFSSLLKPPIRQSSQIGSKQICR